MTKNLLFDFTVNKENRTVRVAREFDADLALVWKAWTTAELLDQWWAPKPYRNLTKTLDLRNGGQWVYCMISPENEVHWCKADYEKIQTEKILDWYDAFCDEQGNLNTALPRTRWANTFSQKEDTTLVDVVIEMDTLEDLEALIAMGFKEGFTMGLGNLDELLASIRNRE
jgi:uncharacterized protein YndB with AHSA1/START domain